MIGLLISISLFTGVDGAIHMSEGVKNAAVVVPHSIMTSISINGALGLGILLTALYATTNIEDTLSSQAGEARYPFLYILQNGIGSLGGAVAMGAIIAVMQTFGISLIWRLPHVCGGLLLVTKPFPAGAFFSR
jgi:choline transport protein